MASRQRYPSEIASDRSTNFFRADRSTTGMLNLQSKGHYTTHCKSNHILHGQSGGKSAPKALDCRRFKTEVERVQELITLLEVRDLVLAISLEQPRGQ